MTTTIETRSVCPACGSEEIEGLAWVRINGEVLKTWDEGAEYWCPRCERHYKAVCEVDLKTSHCFIHERPVARCRQEYQASVAGLP